jgi:hypothetical protein
MKPLGAAFITFVRFRDPRRPLREPSEGGFAAEPRERRPHFETSPPHARVISKPAQIRQ